MAGTHTKEERVRALATEDAFAAARAQGYEAPAGAERETRRGRAVEGVQGTLDLVVLAG